MTDHALLAQFVDGLEVLLEWRMETLGHGREAYRRQLLAAVTAPAVGSEPRWPASC